MAAISKRPSDYIEQAQATIFYEVRDMALNQMDPTNEKEFKLILRPIVHAGMG